MVTPTGYLGASKSENIHQPHGSVKFSGSIMSWKTSGNDQTALVLQDVNYLKHFHFQIGIPVLGDQPGNSLEAEKKGYGINIPIYELTEEKLSTAIQEMLANDSFAKRAKEHGTLVMDQITQPIDRAVWWIEYAMRHKGR